MIRILLLLAFALPAHAQTPICKTIAQCAVIIRAQADWIRSADAVIRDLQCAMSRHMDAHKAINDGLRAVPPIYFELTISDTACGLTTPAPVLMLAP